MSTHGEHEIRPDDEKAGFGQVPRGRSRERSHLALPLGELVDRVLAGAGLDALPIDVIAAGHWATLRVRLAEEGRRINVNDLWIAAVAAANDLPVITQDSDYDPLETVGGPLVIRI